MTKEQTPQPETHKNTSNRLPRFVLLGLPPNGFTEAFTTALSERGVRALGVDEGRVADRVEGVFYGRESAFEDQPKTKLGKMLGRLAQRGEEHEDVSIPQGVIVFPKIKDAGNEVDTPVEEIEALCAQNEVPFLLVDAALHDSNTGQLVESLLALPEAK